MAVTGPEAKAAADDARDEVYDKWRANFTAVARDQKNLSLLDSVPATFKNAAALGLGMSATTLMFPEAAKKITGAIAVPLTLVNMAMTAYQTTYQDSAKRENMLLNNTYEEITDLFCDELDAVKGAFVRTELGQAMTKFTDDIAQKLKDKAETTDILQADCVKAVAAVIDPRSTTARARLKVGFVPMCENIHAVYAAWHDYHNGIGFKDVLIRLHPDRQVNYTRIPGGGGGSDFFRTLRSPIPTRLLNPIPEKNEYTTRGPKQETVNKRAELNWVLANIANLEVESVPYKTKGDETYVWPINEPASKVPSMSQANIGDVRSLMHRAVGLA